MRKRIKTQNKLNMNKNLLLNGLYYDVIGIIGEYIHGEKSYWKTRFKDVIEIISNDSVKDNRINYNDYITKITAFLLLQGDYNIHKYESGRNEIVLRIYSRGKTCSVNEFIKSQNIHEQLFYKKYLKTLHNMYTDDYIYDYIYKKINTPDSHMNVYKFGNKFNVNSIMNNRWVGNLYQQDKMILVLHEIKHYHHEKERKKKIEKRRNCFFQLHSVFSTRQFIYKIVGVYSKHLKLQDQYDEYKYCRYMKDEDDCIYVFADKLYRYKYFTDNTIEKIW